MSLLRYQICPRLEPLYVSHHLVKFLRNGLVLDQLLSERAPVVRLPLAIFLHSLHDTDTSGEEAPAFVVEVHHHYFEALVFFSDNILDWHLHIVKDDIGRATGPDSLALQVSDAHAR